MCHRPELTAVVWDCAIQSLKGGEHYVPRLDGSPVTYADILRRWRDDAVFRSFFLSLLTDTLLLNYRWETPPVTAAAARRNFEFVLLDAPYLACAADPRPFAFHFEGTRDARDVLAVPNLSGDALMVIPTPVGPQSAYADLASFVREAPEPQQHALWQMVGQSMQARLGNEPVWLSTAGGGVAWLHVRIDRRPKYYGFAPYRALP